MTENTKALSITLKGGTEYDAPWIVIYANTPDEGRDIIGQVEQSGLLADVGRVSAGLQAQNRLGKQAGARPVNAPQTAPQAPQQSWGDQGTQQFQQPAQAPQQGGWQPPAQQQWGGQQQGANPADAKHCIHGPMTFRAAGISKRTNQPYSAFWACGSNVKGCKAIN